MLANMDVFSDNRPTEGRTLLQMNVNLYLQCTVKQYYTL